MRLRQVVSLALALAGILGACGHKKPSSVPLGGEDEPTAQAGSRSVSEGSARPQTPSEEPEQEAPPADEIEEDDEDFEDEDEGDDDESQARADQAKLASAAETAGAPPCDDSRAEALECRRAAESCPVIRPLCTRIGQLLKPKVAQAFLDCVAEEGCDLAMGERCVRTAIRAACVDDPARALCRERQVTCRRELEAAKVTLEDCEYAVSSLAPEARGRFTTCLEQTCDRNELESCLVRLLAG